MRIVADAAIPLAGEAFCALGDVVLYPGDAIRRRHVRNADLLLVRSVTRVDSSLLDGTGVRFVGSATTGIDHVDVDYLRARGIAFESAAGCNSNSVAEHVVATLLTLASRREISLQGKSLGVVGVGRIGSRVSRFARALGMKVLENDPPLAKRTGSSDFVSLDELGEVDFLTIHVPLTREGAYPTFRLVDSQRLKRLSRSTILINTSRGRVVDGTDLRDALASGNLAGAVLDVWENEPAIDYALLDLVDIGTPHVAGYSLDGKLNGTRMLLEGACRFLEREARWEAGAKLLELCQPRLVDLRDAKGDEFKLLSVAVNSCCNVLADDRRLRAGGRLQTVDRSAYFFALRKHYPVRCEFYHTTVRVDDQGSRVARTLLDLGFQVAAE